MRFINVTDEAYEKLEKVRSGTNLTMPEVIDTIIEGYTYFGNLSIAQDLALQLADSILKEQEGDDNDEHNGI